MGKTCISKNGGLMKEHYRVEYSEQSEVMGKTTHTTYIARNPHIWLECRRQFERNRPSHQPRIKIVILGDVRISKEEYDTYNADEKERLLAAIGDRT